MHYAFNNIMHSIVRAGILTHFFISPILAQCYENSRYSMDVLLFFVKLPNWRVRSGVESNLKQAFLEQESPLWHHPIFAWHAWVKGNPLLPEAAHSDAWIAVMVGLKSLAPWSICEAFKAFSCVISLSDRLRAVAQSEIKLLFGDGQLVC